MLWNENYKIGIELIDRQHRELFDMTEHLLNTIKGDDALFRKQESISAIQFLKDYTIKHFDAEESYMSSKKYCDFENHKAIHKKFIASVLESEKNLIQSNFSIPAIKKFAGFLTAWLIYHVANADQKLSKDEYLIDKHTAAVNFYIHCFSKSFCCVLNDMLRLDISNIIYFSESGNKGDILIQVGLKGDFEGSIDYIFPQNTSFDLIKAMFNFEIDEIDEIVYSALSEIATVTSVRAVSLISGAGRKCSIKAPRVLLDSGRSIQENGFHLDTKYGKISACLHI